MTADGQPIPLQVIPPRSNQQAEIHAQIPEVLLLPWKGNVALEEQNSEHGEQSQPDQSETNEGMGMHVLPTEDDSGNNLIPDSNSAERVASNKTLISPIGGNQEGTNVDSQRIEVENVVGNVNPEKGSENVEGTDVGEEVDSPKENQDDDVVVVSSTASRRRTRASVAALEKKRVAMGVGGEAAESAELDEAIDLEELERLGEVKKAKKGKGKARWPSNVESHGPISKKRKGIVILEPSRGKNKDNFVIVDIEDVVEEDIATLARRKSKEKLRVNDDRNRIKNS
ncbi:hypothetical protein LIER_12147 [Lithospermum erythrorhizon]|uniref:Uncharacterized protein n=1 Tax=Lithospermum erythrorhizon TaxID=34254 RepID=A0AAV3PTM2_LITER